MDNKRKGAIIGICIMLFSMSVYAMEYISESNKGDDNLTQIDSANTEKEVDEEELFEPNIKIPEVISSSKSKSAKVKSTLNKDSKNSDIKANPNKNNKDSETKKEDKKESNNSSKKENNNSSNTDSKVKISMPTTAYVSDYVKVATSNVNDMSLEKVTKDGKVVDFSKYIEGDIESDEHIIKFNEKGSYSLRLRCKDSMGKSFMYEASTKVYPIIETKFSMPKVAYKNDLVEIKTLFKNTEQVKWDVFKNGKSVSMKDAIEGTISNEGGKIKFKDDGEYKLKASATDDLGRKFEYSSSITVHPELVFDFNMDELTYTDKKALIKPIAEDIEFMKWSVYNDKDSKDILESLDNNLSNKGGYIQFDKSGIYTVKLTAKDKFGKVYEKSKSINVYPVLSINFTLPNTAYENSKINVYTENINNLHVRWDLIKDGKSMNISDALEGTLNDYGGKIGFKDKGSYQIIATVTDKVGRKFSTTKNIKVYKELDSGSSNSNPTEPITNVNVTNIVKDGKFFVNISAESTDADKGDEITYEYKGKSEDNYYKPDTYTIKVRAVDNRGGSSKWVEVKFNVINSVPTNPVTKVNVTRTFKDGKFLVNISAKSTDINEGDKITYEYEGKSEDNYYEIGSHIVKVRAKDSCGDVSEWVEVKFDVVNSAPTNPVAKADVTRTFKDGKFLVNISAESTDADGDEITYEYKGKSEDNYYEVGKHVVKVRANDNHGGVSEWIEIPFTISSSAPTNPVTKANVTRIMKDGKFLVNISAESTDADGDGITYEYEGKSEDNYYEVGKHIVKVRAIDYCGGVSEWVEIPFTVSSSAPTKPVTKADVTRTFKDGKFLVNISAESTDADGDKITYEYQGKSEDNYYEVGKHIVKVRAIDDCGGASEWVEILFTISSSAPTAPTITRTPNGNSVAPNTPVTITATSNDADGDKITYIWENRPSETSVYPLGKNVVRVKAVDSTGKESPWSAIVFFVMDSNGKGGMTLTGSGSSIIEEGIKDATITSYTFTVPPVESHNGDDYARVKGFNIKTNAWEELEYKTTKNGITFSKALPKNTYSKLDFYYYTNHNCMYNKSNITYSVDYYFE